MSDGGDMSTPAVELSVSKATCLVDEEFSVSCRGLRPAHSVTIAAIVNYENKRFVSCAHFNADSEGIVDLDRTASAGGTYSGVDKMGLIWSMKPDVRERRGTRLIPTLAEIPIATQILVLDGHRRFEDICVWLAEVNEKGTTSSPNSNITSIAVLARTALERTYKPENVSRQNISEGRLRGSLFAPKGDEKYPGILDLFGTSGGLCEHRGALLASYGFVVYSLPYFRYPDLPATLKDLELEYFLDGLDLLARSDRVLDANSLGIVSTSKGTDFAFLAAQHDSRVKAVTAIGPTNHILFNDVLYDGGRIKALQVDFRKLCPIVDNVVHWRNPKHIEEEFLLKVAFGAVIVLQKALEQSKARYLFISGGEDPCSNNEMIDPMMERLKKAGWKEPEDVKKCIFAGAGHLIEPPFAMHFGLTYMKALSMYVHWGGAPVAHARAQRNAWREIITFFHRTLAGNHRLLREPLSSVL